MLGIGKMSALSKRVEHTVRKRIRERLAPDVELERNDALPSQWIVLSDDGSRA